MAIRQMASINHQQHNIITVLRVSDNTVVMAIMLFNRKGQNSHHHSSKTVSDIKMSFWAFDYVVEVTTWLKFGVAPPKGGGPTIG